MSTTTTTSATVPQQRPVPESLEAITTGDRPVLEAIAAMNLDTLELSTLDAQTYFLVRLAALVAVDGPPASYLVTLGLAADAGITDEQVRGVLTAIAPVVGSPRIVSAAGQVLRAIGLAVMAEEAGAEGEGD